MVTWAQEQEQKGRELIRLKQELIDAVKNDRVDYIESLVNRANDGDTDSSYLLELTTTKEGQTALHYAASLGHVKLVETLLQFKGTDVNQACIIDEESRLRDAVQAFLDTRSLEAFEDYRGKTALILAAKEGHTDVVNLLLTVKGIKENQADQDGKTALMHAAVKGHAAIVDALCNEEAIDVNHAGYDGKTALKLVKYHLTWVSIADDNRGENIDEIMDEKTHQQYDFITQRLENLQFKTLVKGVLDANDDEKLSERYKAHLRQTYKIQPDMVRAFFSEQYLMGEYGQALRPHIYELCKAALKITKDNPEDYQDVNYQFGLMYYNNYADARGGEDKERIWANKRQAIKLLLNAGDGVYAQKLRSALAVSDTSKQREIGEKGLQDVVPKKVKAKLKGMLKRKRMKKFKYMHKKVARQESPAEDSPGGSSSSFFQTEDRGEKNKGPQKDETRTETASRRKANGMLKGRIK